MDDRAEFEAWFADNGGPQRMHASYPADYVESAEKDAAWSAWQAARRTPPAQAGAPDWRAAVERELNLQEDAIRADDTPASAVRRLCLGAQAIGKAGAGVVEALRTDDEGPCHFHERCDAVLSQEVFKSTEARGMAADYFREGWEEAAKVAALSAAPHPEAPAGYVLVPVEPTDNQVRACMGNEAGGLVTPDYRRAIYRAMLSAAPTPPQPAAQPGEEAPRRVLVGYDDCRCILTQYCDGKCRPIFADELKAAARAAQAQGDTP